MKKYVGVKYTFPTGEIAEFTWCKDCHLPPEEWVAMHLEGARPGGAKRERFESDVPVDRQVDADGKVTTHPVTEGGFYE